MLLRTPALSQYLIYLCRLLLLAEGMRQTHAYKKRARLRLLVAVNDDLEAGEVHAELTELMHRYRIEAEPVVVAATESPVAYRALSSPRLTPYHVHDDAVAMNQLVLKHSSSAGAFVIGVDCGCADEVVSVQSWYLWV